MTGRARSHTSTWIDQVAAARPRTGRRVAYLVFENDELRVIIGALRDHDMPDGTNRYQDMIDVLTEALVGQGGEAP